MVLNFTHIFSGFFEGRGDVKKVITNLIKSIIEIPMRL